MVVLESQTLRDHVLPVAEIHWLLRGKVTRNHWEMLLDEAHTLQEPMHFLGLDVYNEFRSSAFAGCEVLDDTQSNWVDEEELRLRVAQDHRQETY
eukprot:5241851-Amphidinium_carterae.1